MKDSRFKFWLLFCLILAILVLGIGLIFKEYQASLIRKYFNEVGISKYKLGLEAVTINYGDAIKKEADFYKLNPFSLKALCMLECGGRKKVPSRFEKHIYKELLRVKNTPNSHFEQIKHHQIRMLSNSAIKNLASSWGPFQLMGVRSINMHCSISELRGDNSVHYAIKWINEEYGYLIKKERYKDAFHKHNTGRLYPKIGPPKTHDPQYVNKGLKFMGYYSKSE